MPKVFRCTEDVTKMDDCRFVIQTATVDEVIQHAKLHATHAHGIPDEAIDAAQIALWRSRIKDVPTGV
jgi:predicted small metal-binding protein